MKRFGGKSQAKTFGIFLIKLYFQNFFNENRKTKSRQLKFFSRSKDDMVDDMKSFVAAAEVLKERGAYKIYVLATHGLLSSDAPSLIEDSPIDEVVVTNTVPHELQKMQCHKIKTVDISVLLSEAIRRIHNKESMSYLFKNVTLED